MSRLKIGLIKIFLIAFALFSFCIFLTGVVGPLFIRRYRSFIIGDTGSLFGLSAALVLFACIVLLLYLTITRALLKTTESKDRLITWSLCFIMLFIEVAIIYVFRDIRPPIVDGGHVYLKAMDLVQHTEWMKDVPYFQVYPNNVPITVLRYWLYWLFSFGHTEAFLYIDRAFCALALNTALFFSWKIVLELFDRKMGNLFLILALTCFPLFFYILYFYTDTAAVLFPPILLYLWLKLHRTKKVRFLILLGACLAVGCQIRPNLILFFPALIIYMLFVLKFRRTIIYSLVIAVVLAAVQWTAPIYYQHLGFEKDQQLEMPSSHWIMMGLAKNGRYNFDDFKFTQSFADPGEKKAANWHEAKNRMEAWGPTGLTALWTVKAARTFADGTMGYHWYSSMTDRYSIPYDYIFGEQNQLMLLIIQVFRIVNLFLLMLSAFRFFRTRTIDAGLLIQICLFGNFLFYTFLWEAEPRYSLLFIMFILIANVYGLRECQYWVDSFKQRYSGTMANRLIPSVITAGLLGSLLACAVINYSSYTQVTDSQKRYIVNQDQKKGTQKLFVDRDHIATQTFYADKPFDHLALGVNGWVGQGNYRVTVKNSANGELVASEDLPTPSFLPDRLAYVSFDQEIPKNRQGYTLQVKQISGSQDAELSLGMFGKGTYEQRDIYPMGQLSQNDRRFSHIDLQFQVYRADERPYLNGATYSLLFIIPVLILSLYVSQSLKEASIRYSDGRIRQNRSSFSE